MTRWRTSVLAILLASFPGVVSAQVDCDAVPHGPARTDCYVGLSRVYRGQSDVAAGNARAQSDAARLQQVTGTRNHSKASKHRRKKTVTVGRRLALQHSRLLDHAREVRDHLFVDGRRLRLSRLPDLRHVAAGQDREQTRGHSGWLFALWTNAIG